MLRWRDLTVDGKWATVSVVIALIGVVTGMVVLTLHR